MAYPNRPVNMTAPKMGPILLRVVRFRVMLRLDGDSHRSSTPNRATEMAKNTGQGHRVGSVTDRSQTFNPRTDQYVKRDDSSGRFMATKDSPFKGVAQEPDGRKR
jgi:hypothetical protein